jgi:hypothetical protein
MREIELAEVERVSGVAVLLDQLADGQIRVWRQRRKLRGDIVADQCGFLVGVGQRLGDGNVTQVSIRQVQFCVAACGQFGSTGAIGVGVESYGLFSGGLGGRRGELAGGMPRQG